MPSEGYQQLAVPFDVSRLVELTRQQPTDLPIDSIEAQQWMTTACETLSEVYPAGSGQFEYWRWFTAVNLPTLGTYSGIRFKRFNYQLLWKHLTHLSQAFATAFDEPSAGRLQLEEAFLSVPFAPPEGRGVSRPDWRKPWGPASRMEPRYWAWQFLRRNREYIRSWTDALSIYNKTHRASPGSRPEFHPLFSIPSPQSERRWRLYGGLRNPEIAKPLGLVIGSPVVYEGKFASRVLLDLSESEVAIVFDTSRPYSRQVNVARSFLCDRSSPSASVGIHRHHRRKWELYLRALDAAEQGLTMGSIGLQMFGLQNDWDVGASRATRRISDMLEQARRYVDGGYQDIVTD